MILAMSFLSTAERDFNPICKEGRRVKMAEPAAERGIKKEGLREVFAVPPFFRPIIFPPKII